MRFILFVLLILQASQAFAYLGKGDNKAEFAGMLEGDSDGSYYQMYIAEKKFVLDRFGIGLNGELWGGPDESWYSFGVSGDYYLAFVQEDKGVFVGFDVNYNKGKFDIDDSSTWLVTNRLRLGLEELVTDTATVGVQFYIKHKLLEEDGCEFETSYGILLGFSLLL